MYILIVLFSLFFYSNRVNRVQENKGIQAPSPGNFTESFVDPNKHKLYILSEKRAVTPVVRLAKKTRTVAIPNMIKKKTSAETLLLEDVEGNEYRILDKPRLSWSNDTPPDTRQEMFFKQGNAEILRIMSNDSLEVMDSASNVHQDAFNVFDEMAGKKAIMDKFLNSQSDGIFTKDLQHDEGVQVNITEMTQKASEEIRKETAADILEEQKKLATFQRDVLLTK